jgi:glycosyltransferase involved in cell wall biosynthesis
MRVWLPAIRAGSGADVFTQRLADGLRQRGIDVLVTWYPHRYELWPQLLRLQKVPLGVDVIHVNSWSAHAFLGRGVPVVTTVLHLVHDPAYAPYRSPAQALYHRWHLRWRELRALRHSLAVTAISEYVADTVRTFCGRGDVTTILNWVDTAQYTPAAGGAPDPRGPFRLLLVGNQTRRKGFDLLGSLATRLGPGFELRCTGGLRDGGLVDMAGVQLLGRLSEADLVREYQACHAVISLSRYEGFGYTALEGMACGKPVVAFRTSALTEVIDDGVTGFLATKDDVAAMAARCRELADDRVLTERMGHAARRRAIEHFPEAGAIDAYVQTYERVIRQNRPIPCIDNR